MEQEKQKLERVPAQKKDDVRMHSGKRGLRSVMSRNDEQRERLVELLLNVDYALNADGRKAEDSAEFIADYLIQKKCSRSTIRIR